MKKWKQIRRASLIVAVTLWVCTFLGNDVIVATEQGQEQEWRYSKEIEMQGEGPYQALFLDEEVYAGADDDLCDLRIVNHKGQYVPYYIDSGYGEAKEKTITYSSSLIHTAMKDGNSILDYKITPKAENVDIQGNILTLELPKVDFLKQIDVYGSYDGVQWGLVENTGREIYRTDQLVKDSIPLGTAYKYEYYRLIVRNNVENLTFPELQLVHNMKDFKWKDYKKVGDASFELKQEDGFTQIVVNNSGRLRINETLLRVDNSNFTRSYKLYDDQGMRVDTVGEQNIYNMEFKDWWIRNYTIATASPIRNPHYTIQINNLDDTPLNITGVVIEYILDKVVFEDKGEGPYTLLYGNASASEPQYDIVNFKSHIEQEGIAVGKLSEQVVAPGTTTADKDPAWWQQQKLWFNTIIAVVALLLIVLLVKKMKLKP